MSEWVCGRARACDVSALRPQLLSHGLLKWVTGTDVRNPVA